MSFFLTGSQNRPTGEEFVKADEERVSMEKKLQDMNVKPSVFHDVSDEVHAFGFDNDIFWGV